MQLITDFSRAGNLNETDWENGLHALETLVSGQGKGSEFTGWIRLPFSYDTQEYERIKQAAQTIREQSEVLLCVGIGGSYLGTKAVLDSLLPYFGNPAGPEILYAGQTLSSSYLRELKDYLADKDYSVNVISKSGTTTESALAYRVIAEWMQEKYTEEEIRTRTFITTDKEKGALKTLADEKGYETFVVPDDIGGRYSFLSAVGLLPIAAAGVDIDALLRGAQDASALYTTKEEGNAAVEYALHRNRLLQEGKDIELFVAYEPNLMTIGEWFKQLFGESEGKEGKGIFPASLQFTTDLHSMGQMIQEGQRNLFETVLFVEEPVGDLTVPKTEEDLDGLNYLAGASLHEVNEKARRGVLKAHVAGGVPNIFLQIAKADAYHIGALLYFFMIACGVSATLLGVNPFNQPGVEAYKVSMFRELGKPGFTE